MNILQLQSGIRQFSLLPWRSGAATSNYRQTNKPPDEDMFTVALFPNACPRNGCGISLRQRFVHGDERGMAPPDWAEPRGNRHRVEKHKCLQETAFCLSAHLWRLFNAWCIHTRQESDVLHPSKSEDVLKSLHMIYSLGLKIVIQIRIITNLLIRHLNN